MSRFGRIFVALVMLGSAATMLEFGASAQGNPIVEGLETVNKAAQELEEAARKANVEILERMKTIEGAEEYFNSIIATFRRAAETGKPGSLFQQNMDKFVAQMETLAAKARGGKDGEAIARKYQERANLAKKYKADAQQLYERASRDITEIEQQRDRVVHLIRLKEADEALKSAKGVVDRMRAMAEGLTQVKKGLTSIGID